MSHQTAIIVTVVVSVAFLTAFGYWAASIGVPPYAIGISFLWIIAGGFAGIAVYMWWANRRRL